MIKILSNEPNTVFYKDVKVGESFVLPGIKDAVYVKTKNAFCAIHNFKGNNETYEANCVNIVTGEFTLFCEDDEVYLIDATVKWEYCNKKE